MLDKSLLIVTADHGEGFVPGEQARTLDAATAADLGFVPMFMKLPEPDRGQARRAQLDPRRPRADHRRRASTSSCRRHLDGQSALQPPRTSDVKYWYNTPGKQLAIPDPAGNYQKVIKGYGGVLGNAKSAADLFKLGPRPDLIGKSVSSLTMSGNSSLTVSLNGAVKSAARSVTSTSAVPTLIWGHLNGKVGGTIAVAVNGVIGAVVPTYADNGAPLSIEAIVPTSLWHNGANDISVYTVGGSGATTQLHHVRTA